ncbi:hypothetical protein E2C01_056061 [Portunus trituberculatus]|uniref:Uncharacterized protein n=1 Tax=Portunus trituberculatus TaxID=210409 RepID=A0A5B7GT29_PORTR|nr:hypothetical protein [Portunus trituberculatus]
MARGGGGGEGEAPASVFSVLRILFPSSESHNPGTAPQPLRPDHHPGKAGLVRCPSAAGRFPMSPGGNFGKGRCSRECGRWLTVVAPEDRNEELGQRTYWLRTPLMVAAAWREWRREGRGGRLSLVGGAAAEHSGRRNGGCRVGGADLEQVGGRLTRPLPAGQQQFRAFALGQRPFLDTRFSDHLRELELRRKSDSIPPGIGFKVPHTGPSSTQGRLPRRSPLP